MDRDAALEKIRKCLALSQSPNENEAKTALLMARRLMAEYRIGSLDGIDEKQDPEERNTPFTYTTIRDSWIAPLSELIASRYCCRPFCTKEYGKKTRTASFLGFPEDLDVCIPAFGLAVTSVRYGIRRLGLDRAASDSYARGFIRGLEEEFARQDAEMEAALCTERSLVTIMGVPDEVDEYARQNFRRSKVSCRSYSLNENAFGCGYSDGRNHVRRKVYGDPPKQLR